MSHEESEKDQSGEEHTVSMRRSPADLSLEKAKSPLQNPSPNDIEIERQKVQEEANALVKHKLRKYKVLLERYMDWVEENIICIQSKDTCDDHKDIQEGEEDEILLCIQCQQLRKEANGYKELKAMESYKYLSVFLAKELANLRKGEIDLKNLLRLLKEINVWLKVLSAPYIRWRTKEDYVEVERCIIKCLEKIIEYKKLGPEFGLMMQKTKQENQANWKQSRDYRVTRSQRASKRLLNYNEVLLQNQNNIEVNEGKVKQEYQKFLAMLERDQIYSNFKIIIVRDTEDKSKLKVLDKKEYIRRIKRKRKIKSIEIEKNAYDTEDQEENAPDSKLERQVQRILKKPRLNKVQLKQEQEEERKQFQKNEIEKDLEFLENYKLRSNVLIIEKYHAKSQLNWDQKWEKIFGPVPDRLPFQDSIQNAQ